MWTKGHRILRTVNCWLRWLVIDYFTLKHDRTGQRLEPNFVLSFILGFLLKIFGRNFNCPGNAENMPLILCSRAIVTYSNADGLAWLPEVVINRYTSSVQVICISIQLRSRVRTGHLPPDLPPAYVVLPHSSLLSALSFALSIFFFSFLWQVRWIELIHQYPLFTAL